MTIEEQLHEALAASVALAVERDDLRATVEKLTVGAADELTAAKADIATKDARLAELTVAVDGLSAEVVSLKATIAALESGKVSASKEAAKIAASVGVAPVQMSPADNAKAEPEAVDHVAAFLALPVGSAERAAYFKANQAAIVRGIF
jgi:seryl-tRNA synthetase